MSWREHLINRARNRELAVVVADAVGELLEMDGELLCRDVNERSVCHRLATYLEAKLPTWHVDCEYNRDGHYPKALRGVSPEGEETDGTEGSRVFPDIIVHRRGTQENRLVVEVKKSTSRLGDDWDKRKLKAFRSELGYEHELFLRLRAGDREAEVDAVEWIV